MTLERSDSMLYTEGFFCVIFRKGIDSYAGQNHAFMTGQADFSLFCVHHLNNCDG